jgi:hypothetical protein
MIKKARALKPEDIEKVKEFQEKFYPDYPLPDFAHDHYCAFAITDDEDKIVLAAGLRPTAEILLFADKDMPKVKIVKALLEAKNASLYVGKRFGLNELVAFVEGDDTFAKGLITHGFYPRSSAFSIKVPHG